tara:strand:+ start:1167 stop:1568 length:402 start_codon:yes stop_codon:yes gene_type:complete
MLLFDWTKVYDISDGNIEQCNMIMEMIIKKSLPKNNHDLIAKYKRINFIGSNFLIHPDVLIFNAYRYHQRELAVYYALAALRSLQEYKTAKKLTLDTAVCPVDLETITDNRLLRIEKDSIHFIYEEVRQENIH